MSPASSIPLLPKIYRKNGRWYVKGTGSVQHNNQAWTWATAKNGGIAMRGTVKPPYRS